MEVTLSVLAEKPLIVGSVKCREKVTQKFVLQILLVLTCHCGSASRGLLPSLKCIAFLWAHELIVVHFLWRYNAKYTCWCEILDRLCNACTLKRAFEPWFGTLAFQLAVESIHGQPISTEMYVSTRPQLPNYSTASKISISFAVGLLFKTRAFHESTKNSIFLDFFLFRYFMQKINDAEIWWLTIWRFGLAQMHQKRFYSKVIHVKASRKIDEK